MSIKTNANDYFNIPNEFSDVKISFKNNKGRKTKTKRDFSS